MHQAERKWIKRKANENYKRKVTKRTKKNQVEAYILDSRTSKNGGWLTSTDLLMCPQHL
jgi:hypothetical protein